MSTESSLERRAAPYAALGDPARLRLVELLTVSDVLPSDLAVDLGIGSNLLAHHLKVLEGAGLVRRRRSEGDRRRTYVQLVPGALPTLPRAELGVPPRVLFVCTANTARSQLAAALWAARAEVPVASAGTHPADAVHPRAVAAARRHDLRLAPRARPRRLDAVHRPGDLVVTVCDRAREELAVPGALHWSVPDPVPVGTDRAFDAAYRDLDERVHGLAERLAVAS